MIEIICEHLIFGAALAVIIGMILNHYKKPDISWLVIIMAFIPDTDFIFQMAWYDFSIPFMPTICHGDFHCLVALFLAPAIFAWVFSRYKINFSLAYLVGFIGYAAHLIEDMIANSSYYYMFWPLKIKVPVWGIIKETRNFYGIGDVKIILIAIAFLFFAVSLRNHYEGSQWITRYISWLNPKKFWDALTA